MQRHPRFQRRLPVLGFVVVPLLVVVLAGALVGAASASSFRGPMAVVPNTSTVYLPLVYSCSPTQVIVQPASQPFNTNEMDFTFTGTCFTPNGLLHRSFTDPQSNSYALGDINADSTGSFGRILQLINDPANNSFWPTGTYTYFVTDATTGKVFSVQFSITSSTASVSAAATSPSSKQSRRFADSPAAR